ncbi:MAG: ABC transporter permease [Chloroflexi bacterium]|nr:MAG: ABC transporter permease [Chloroflexota bacterium]
MAKFVGARLLESIPVLVLSSLLVFSVLHLIPGDPVDAMLGVASFGVGDPELLKKQEEAIRLELGLNDPLPIQYLNWVVLSVVFGIGLGILAAIQRNSPLDRIVMLVSLGGVSTPSFFFAMLLILLLSVGLGLLPATGSGGLDRLIMPALVLGYNATGLIARLTRASLLEVLGREYITTARAKGLPFRLIIGRHAMRNALIPIVTIVGLQLGQLVAGSVIVETVFARQGIGQLAIDAILSKDYPVVQGVILLTASSYVVANLLVDISYGFINPRIRTS